MFAVLSMCIAEGIYCVKNSDKYKYYIRNILHIRNLLNTNH